MVMQIVKILLSLVLPPAAAFLQVGLTKHFWINIVLTIVGFYIGGIVHALWLVLGNKKAS